MFLKIVHYWFFDRYNYCNAAKDLRKKWFKLTWEGALACDSRAFAIDRTIRESSQIYISVSHVCHFSLSSGTISPIILVNLLWLDQTTDRCSQVFADIVRFNGSTLWSYWIVVRRDLTGSTCVHSKSRFVLQIRYKRIIFALSATAVSVEITASTIAIVSWKKKMRDGTFKNARGRRNQRQSRPTRIMAIVRRNAVVRKKNTRVCNGEFSRSYERRFFFFIIIINDCRRAGKKIEKQNDDSTVLAYPCNVNPPLVPG